MLVDNSIVVIENIYRYNQLGYSPRESAWRGAGEVGLAITAATLTTIVVFIPVLYLESGQMASSMKQLGLPITVALLASLVIALTLIPLFASRMQEMRADAEHPVQRRLTQLAEMVFGKRAWGVMMKFGGTHPIKLMIDLYVRSLGWTLRNRLAAIALLLLSPNSSCPVPIISYSLLYFKHFSTKSGAILSSASSVNIHSPVACLIPAFLADDKPPFSFSISFTSNILATSLVLSVLPSFTTITSHFTV